MTLLVRETYVNETKGHQYGDSDWQEAFTDDRGKLFKMLQREYGRCISSMYRDRANKPPERVGWVFQSRERYEDARPGDRDATYIRETWVEVRSDSKPITLTVAVSVPFDWTPEQARDYFLEEVIPRETWIEEPEKNHDGTLDTMRVDGVGYKGGTFR